MNTASNLRWRARVTKEALLLSEEDDSLDRWEIVENHHHNNNNNSTQSDESPHRSSLLVDTLALGGLLASLYMWLLLSWAGPSERWKRFWYYAIAVSTGLFALLVHWQERRLRTLGTLRQQHKTTRRAVRSLQQQNERLCRTLTQLDRTVDRLQLVEEELSKYAEQSQLVPRLVQVVQEYQGVQTALQEQLRKQVQEEILCAVLQTDHNRDFHLSMGPELERLILRLKGLPGVQIQEANLRELLLNGGLSQSMDSEDSSSATNQVPLHAVLQLLRKLSEDAGNPKMKQRRTDVFLDDDDDTTVFRLQPRQLLSDSADLLHFV